MEWEDMLKAFEASSRLNSRRSIGSSLITGLSGILGNVIQGVFNTKQVRETNKVNRELVDIQNQAAKDEAELAYKRSLPQNQVANLMNAGMSRAGAINTLNGGGSYQPAPVTTSQDEAPQIDVSQAINAVQAAAQLEEQRRQFNKSQESQEKMHKAQIESNERIAQLQADTTNRNSDNTLEFQREKWSIEMHYVNKNIDKITADIAKVNAETLGVQFDNVRKDLENKNLPTLLRLANSKTIKEIGVLAAQIEHAKATLYGQKLDNSLKEYELEFMNLTKTSRTDMANLTNELTSVIASKDKDLLLNSVGADYIHALMFIMKNCSPSLFKP